MFFSKFITALAPMEDVTDVAFRRICKKYGADLLFTEFVSAHALVRKVEKSLKKITFHEEERPIGIQLFGDDPQIMAEAAKIVEEFSPDFIDLNFGCPVKKIVEKGAGAALLKDTKKLLKITDAVVKSVSLPVSVKTRLGWDEKNIVIVDLAEKLQDVGIAFLTIHARTKTQMYKGFADWAAIGEIKNNQRIKIPIIGNGDVNSPEKAQEMKNKYGVDGVMIGRAAIGNPWIFNDIKVFLNENKISEDPDIKEKVDVCVRHLLETIKVKGEKTAILEMRKHYSGYFRAYPDFKQFRTRLVSETSLENLLECFSEIKNYYSK